MRRNNKIKKAVYFPSPAKEVKQTAFILGVFYKLVLIDLAAFTFLTRILLYFKDSHSSLCSSLKYNNLLRDKCKIGSS